MIVQFSTDTPLGWARMVIRKSTEALAKIAAEALAQTQTDNQSAATTALSEENNLTDLFSDALDDLWGE
jgi:hypothetical protein